MSGLTSSLLATVLVVEREPLTWVQLDQAALGWIRSAGNFAMLALALVFLTRVAQPPRRSETPPIVTTLCYALGGLAALCYAFFLAALFRVFGLQINPVWRDQAHGLGGALAIGAVLLPMLPHVFRLSPRRIWALSRLSFKEAIRRRILWVFNGILLVLMFAGWFMDFRPQDQVRNYVYVVYLSMAILMLPSAAGVAALSIPTDLKNQTMHTIVTKPVERFEIVLGRCLGYVLLMSAVLAGMGALSLVYVARGIDPEAAEESYKARVPIFGDLNVVEAKSVGREWEYRKYIAGGASNEFGVWSFKDVPASLGGRDSVRCEFSFDIFRTTKGKQGRGVYVTLSFETPAWKPARLNDFTEDRAWILDSQNLTRSDAELQAQAQRENWPAERLERRQRLRAAGQKILERAKAENWSEATRLLMLNDPLAQEYGFFEVRSKEVSDYHTFFVDVPGGLFRAAAAAAANSPGAAPLTTIVRCESPSQYLGVARHDLYLLDDERLFEENFFKGLLGLWFRMCLVIVLAVTLSTYLSGIIALLATAFVYGLGLLRPFLTELASGKSYGGGPFQSAMHLALNTSPSVQLDKTPYTDLIHAFDDIFQFVVGFILDLFPTVDRFNLTDHVAQGFNVSAGLLFVDNLIPLVGYCLPWLVLGFYLMQSREIAN